MASLASGIPRAAARRIKSCLDHDGIVRLIRAAIVTRGAIRVTLRSGRQMVVLPVCLEARDAETWVTLEGVPASYSPLPLGLVSECAPVEPRPASPPG